MDVCKVIRVKSSKPTTRNTRPLSRILTSLLGVRIEMVSRYLIQCKLGTVIKGKWRARKTNDGLFVAIQVIQKSCKFSSRPISHQKHGSWERIRETFKVTYVTQTEKAKKRRDFSFVLWALEQAVKGLTLGRPCYLTLYPWFHGLS